MKLISGTYNGASRKTTRVVVTTSLVVHLVVVMREEVRTNEMLYRPINEHRHKSTYEYSQL